jgi:hypothetical protein
MKVEGGCSLEVFSGNPLFARPLYPGLLRASSSSPSVCLSDTERAISNHPEFGPGDVTTADRERALAPKLFRVHSTTPCTCSPIPTRSAAADVAPLIAQSTPPLAVPLSTPPWAILAVSICSSTLPGPKAITVYCPATREAGEEDKGGSRIDPGQRGTDIRPDRSDFHQQGTIGKHEVDGRACVPRFG